jgi:CubicO group peptidase (beta-lactamase class C family)
MARRSLAALLVTSIVGATPLAAQSARPSPDAIGHAVDSLSQRVIAAGLTPALGVAIVMDGRTILARSYGMADVTNGVRADDRTLWYLASTSKSYTGFGVSLLAHQGVLSFERPITTLLPMAQWHPDVDASRLTLGRFLSHTHYINDHAVVQSAAFTGEIPESQWPALIRFARPSGNQNLAYSNFGYNVAAMVIDAKRPEGWRRFLDSAVYRPAGMTETYARVSGLDRRRIATTHAPLANGSFETTTFFKTDATMNSAGGHVATLRDLARWVTVQMDSGVIDGRRVFPAAAVALSHKLIASHTVANSRRFAFFDREGWAAGWDIGAYEGEPMVSRFGSYNSTRSHLSWLPRRRIGVVAQVNGRPGWTATDLVAAFAYDLEAGKPNAREVAESRLQTLVMQRTQMLRQTAAGDSVRASRQRPLGRPLTDLAGTYVNEALGTITFEVRGATLHYKWGALYGPAEVYDAANLVMRIELSGSGTTVPFKFAGSGPATSVEVQGESFVRR